MAPNMMVQVVGVAFLCLSIALTGSASRKEELERAAELAVERTAEIVAERAVEKSLESGNSSTATETIRTSHSTVRKHNKSWQLPGYEYTPEERKNYLRMTREREAAELAVAQIKRGNKFYFKRAVPNDNDQTTEVETYKSSSHAITRIPNGQFKRQIYRLKQPAATTPVSPPQYVENNEESGVGGEKYTKQIVYRPVYYYRPSENQHYHHQQQQSVKQIAETHAEPQTSVDVNKYKPISYYLTVPKYQQQIHEESPSPPVHETDEDNPMTVTEVKQIYRPIYYHQLQSHEHGHSHPENKETKVISQPEIQVAAQPIRFFEVRQKAFPFVYYYHRPPVSYTPMQSRYHFPEFDFMKNNFNYADSREY